MLASSAVIFLFIRFYVETIYVLDGVDQACFAAASGITGCEDGVFCGAEGFAGMAVDYLFADKGLFFAFFTVFCA